MFQRIKNYVHYIESFFAAIFYGFPAKKLTVIGVTGTDGKTTTTHLIYYLLSKAGKRASMISSIDAKIGEKDYHTGLHTTTPRAWMVQKFLKEAVDKGSDFMVLETTSHAIEQNRVANIDFGVSVITNITQEHSFHHRSMNNYIKAKTKLLLKSRISVINYDFTHFQTVKKLLDEKQKKYFTFSLIDKKADFNWSSNFKTAIKGQYNKENILAAYSVCRLLGLNDGELTLSIKTFSLPKGRLETVYKNHFEVVIDFAHTPNSIERLLSTIKEEFSFTGRVIHVFGAASQRDDLKRPLMGKASGRYADVVILTEEDYRHEPINHIWKQIEQGLIEEGFKKNQDEKIVDIANKSYLTIEDREEAILTAVKIARRGDIIVLTGKSHEQSLNRNGKEYPWDEYKAVNSAVKKHNG